MATRKTTTAPVAAEAAATEATKKPEARIAAPKVCAECVYSFDCDRASGKARCSQDNSEIGLSDKACGKGERRQ